MGGPMKQRRESAQPWHEELGVLDRIGGQFEPPIQRQDFVLGWVVNNHDGMSPKNTSASIR